MVQGVVLLRFPISAFCLVGCAMLLQGAGAVVFWSMVVFLVFVSIRLFQFHKEAPGLAVSLLLLELVGGVVMMAMGNYFGFVRYDALDWAVMVGVVGLVWILPNALVLYSQRAKFTEPAKEKPGL